MDAVGRGRRTLTDRNKWTEFTRKESILYTRKALEKRATIAMDITVRKRGRADQRDAASSSSQLNKRLRTSRDESSSDGPDVAVPNINQVLPTEILHVILFDNLDAHYDHVYAKRVCRAWADLLTKRKKGRREPAWSRSATFMEHAALYGHLSVIKWALSEGCPRLGLVANRAARGGHLDLIEYLFSTGWCKSGNSVCVGAALGGHWHVMTWAHNRGCKWDKWTCANAAKGGHLDMLQWLRTNGCPWDKWTCAYAARGGHLHVLEWASANGCPWDSNVRDSAVEGGHVAVLEWARNNGCVWDNYLCSKAAGRGHLTLLQWARANGCPWNTRTTTEAAENGHLETLMWACENGCPVDYGAWALAAEGGHLGVFKWLSKTYGLRYADECRKIAQDNGHHALVAWIDADARCRQENP